jgi:hypothetical protein
LKENKNSEKKKKKKETIQRKLKEFKKNIEEEGDKQ